MERECKFCGKKFKVKKANEHAEYCTVLCWKEAHGLTEIKKDRHYNGGHKNIKRKKNGKNKKRKK